MIQLVDPMAWEKKSSWAEHDALLSISEAGELGFWVPEERTLPGLHATIDGLPARKESQSGWRCTGKVKTGRRGIRKAICSSAKKTALSILLY